MNDLVTKKVYFVEKTQKIEGVYVEIETLFVNENEEQALKKYEEIAAKKQQHSSGVVLNAYQIQAEPGFFKRLMQQFKTLPAEIYRKVRILDCQPVLELCL